MSASHISSSTYNGEAKGEGHCHATADLCAVERGNSWLVGHVPNSLELHFLRILFMSKYHEG